MQYPTIRSPFPFLMGMAALTLALSSHAQTPAAAPQQNSLKQFPRQIWNGQKTIWTTPLRMNKRQWLTLALPVAAGTVGLITLDQRIASGLPNTRDQAHYSRYASSVGAFGALSFITAAPLMTGSLLGKPQVTGVGRSSLEALVDSMIVTQAMKFAFARERPDQNSGEGRFWKGGASFPSGHAFTSWAVAAAVARNPSTPKWLKFTSYGLATAVSLSRMGARRHFASDVFLGSALGAFTGNFVATRPRLGP